MVSAADNRKCGSVGDTREALAQLGNNLVAAKTSIIYSSASNFRWSGISASKCPPAAPVYADAHSFISWIVWTAFGKGVDHLNGQAWQTGTIAGMALRGTQVSESTFLLGSLLNPASVAAARPGDLIFFGVGPSLLAHVAMYMGSNKVLTFGEFNFPGPAAVKIVDLKDFRKDIVQVRSYPLLLI